MFTSKSTSEEIEAVLIEAFTEAQPKVSEVIIGISNMLGRMILVAATESGYANPAELRERLIASITGMIKAAASPENYDASALDGEAEDRIEDFINRAQGGV